MFGSLKKKLKEGVKKLSTQVAEKQEEPTFEKEEQFLHEKEVSVEQVLREEPDKIEQEEEAEEHFEAEPAPDQEPEVREEKLADREPPEPVPTVEDKILKREETLEKKGFLKKLKGVPTKVTEKTLSPGDIDDFVSGITADLLQSNVALEVIDFFKENLKKELVEKKIRRGKTEDIIQQAFEITVEKVLEQEDLEIGDVIKKVRSEKRPALLMVLGFNGSGKTTTIAKLAHLLKENGNKVVFAAADTYRAASVEQLEVHGKKLDIKVVKNKYGSDPAAVVFDAMKHAKANKVDVVIADTAGRVHTNKNLVNELKKIARVNKPDLNILVLDSLTGNDIISQAQKFDEAVGVDGMVLTKLDVNEKGGAVLSAAFVTKKPVLYIGTGQEYKDLERFDPKKMAKELMG